MPITNAEKPAVQLIETEDGSSSLYVPSLNETYHSFHGALRESQHVFIKEGIHYWQSTNKEPAVRILEVGFGTGLNAVLTLQFALKHQIKIYYHTLEPYPLEEELVARLNYPGLLSDGDLGKQFLAIHKVDWNEEIEIDDKYLLHKYKTRLEDFKPDPLYYDLVYYDAFAPNKQAELWTIETFEKIYQSLAPCGILVTYCAKGQFKRDLKAIGFEVQTLPGPPGKKEMVRAIKGR